MGRDGSPLLAAILASLAVALHETLAVSRRVGASAAKPSGVSHFSSSSKAPPSPVRRNHSGNPALRKPSV